MPGDFFSQNMAILRKFNPMLAEELEKEGQGTAPGEIENAISGAPTIVFRSIYLHSKRDPEREAEKLVEAELKAVGIKGEAPAIILGFGLGYTATALNAKLGRHCVRPIIIVEKYPEILKKAFEYRDLSSLLCRKNVIFVLGGTGEGITGALSLFESTPGLPPAIIQNRALTGLDEDWYSVVEDKIKTWNTRTNVNSATQKRFGKRWVGNLSKNLSVIRDIPGISRLEGLLSGEIRGNIPVFLAAAGPSLDAVKTIMGKIHERCIIVAVDTALRFLLATGIEPDFVISVDPQFWNFRHLDRAVAPKTSLIAESAVYPPVLRHNFGSSFLCSSFFPLGRFVEEKVDPKGELGAGGSVATSAWDFIRILGASEVWISGLDLSFPAFKTHFKGAFFEEKSHAESGRFSPAESWNFRALLNGQPFLAKSQNGGDVLTDQRLSLYASWFESRFYQFPGIKNYCLSGEGLLIKGIEIKKTGDLLALPCRREEIGILLNNVQDGMKESFFTAEAVNLRAEKYGNAIKTLQDGLKEIKSLAEEAAETSGIAANRSKQGRLGEKERENIIKKLDAANETIKNSVVKEIVGFLFPETAGWEEEIEDKYGDSFTRYLEFSARFYNALSESTRYNLLKLIN